MIEYTTIKNATQGNTYALQEILDSYESYINRLSTQSYTHENGYITYGIDITIKRQLQSKLLKAILKFKINPKGTIKK